jgi:hypothetical protein
MVLLRTESIECVQCERSVMLQHELPVSFQPGNLFFSQPPSYGRPTPGAGASATRS